MTSVFNTDASLPYNHDLFESLVLKKRINVKGEGTYCQLTTIIPRCLHLQTLIEAIWMKTDNKNATDIGWRGAFSGCVSGSMALHFVGAKCIPND
ncbi:hypothetical protein CSKR_106926 [Clonorchis sinensis]|uniref:Uncharacterized protein n=1 Tax=Clonorchis sinensis TaxID=79923 RepID=A0A3R7DG79_CLOSI|nr:hypothetical protein CSKR_106926 [Clonorchis sinensis]